MNFDERYGWLDRLLYRIAFRAGQAQHAIADVETMMYGEGLPSLTHPVFITALPRSGTTILLKLLWQTGHYGSHTYQDMPFVLCPLLWNQYAQSFATEDTVQERAHGDGLNVSGTSPEAFEEVVWKYFWSDHYGEGDISPWTTDDSNPEFDQFFETHMRKVIAIRERDAGGSLRYLSKNNLNIARLGALPSPLRRGTIVIPFRDPLQQAASMYQQHQRFLEIHEEDDFVREYMEAIGHHEFGKGLKPVNFNGWLENAVNPNELTFWVQYWVAAYRFVLKNANDHTRFLSYERLIEAPRSTLADLAEIVDIPSNTLTSQADAVRAPRQHSVASSAVPDPLRRTAFDLYSELRRQARTSVSE